MTRPNRPGPLDQAERELADALARSAPPPGPSAALDAAILAAARDAAAGRASGGAPVGSPAQPRSPASRHRRRRSPAWLRGGALAATLVIAVGVAWQLRPRFEVPDLATDAPTTATSVPMEPPAKPAMPTPEPALPASPSAAEDDSSGRQALEAADTTAAKARAVAAEAAARAGAEAAREQRRKAEPAAAPAAAPEEPPVVFDAPPPMAAPVPPPAPPAAPAPAAAARSAIPPSPALPSPRRAAPPALQQTADAVDQDDAGEDWIDQPLDDTPPASVDSPAVREAWLARIRELVAAERYTEARESYAEFCRRYPDAEVPDDLRTLLGGE